MGCWARGAGRAGLEQSTETSGVKCSLPPSSLFLVPPGPGASSQTRPMVVSVLEGWGVSWGVWSWRGHAALGTRLSEVCALSSPGLGGTLALGPTRAPGPAPPSLLLASSAFSGPRPPGWGWASGLPGTSSWVATARLYLPCHRPGLGAPRASIHPRIPSAHTGPGTVSVLLGAARLVLDSSHLPWQGSRLAVLPLVTVS